MRYANFVKFFIVLSVVVSTILGPSKTEAFVFEEKVSLTKALAHYAMGQIYDLYGESSMAVLEYEKSVQFDRSSYLTYLRLGVSYARLNMLPDALSALEQVSVHNPDDLQSHYLLALIYSTIKEYDKAASEYEFILKSFSDAEPQNIEIYGYLGQLYYSQKKYDKAIEQFENIYQIEPNNTDIMYLLGSLYFEVSRKAEAVEILKRSIEINPIHDGSLNTLGYIYAEENVNLDQALELVQRALEVSPKNGAYLDSLGWVYYKKEEYKKALEIFLEADSFLKDPVIYNHIGDVYRKLNQPDKAIEYWKLSLGLLPEQDDVIKKIESVEKLQAVMKIKDEKKDKVEY